MTIAQNIIVEVMGYLYPDFKAPDDYIVNIDGTVSPRRADLTIPEDIESIASSEAFINYQNQKEIKAEIVRLESEITIRRLSEAVLTEDGSAWLNSKQAEIAILRDQL